jgi:hypothetical protein
MIYTSFLTFIALIFGIHFYKSRYPKDYDSIILSISTNIQQNDKLKPYLPFLSSIFYYIVYAYSFCQIAATKTIQYCIPYIQIVVKKIFSITNSIINKKSISINVSNNDSINASIIKPLNKSLSTDYDLVLIKSPTNDVIILDNVPDTLDDLKYEVSDIRFFALYLKLHVSETHIIELCKKDANYYVVGNKLDCEFFKYYLHNVLNVQIDNTVPFEYKLELMDQNIKMVYVNETQSIVIEKDGYTIISSTVASLETDKSSNAVEEAVDKSKEKAVETVASLEADKSSSAVVEALSVSEVVEAVAEPKEEPIKVKEEAILDASTVCY